MPQGKIEEETLCNEEDVCLSFLYLQSLQNRGSFELLKDSTKNKIIDSSLKNLKKATDARRKYFNFRKELNLPALNIISKDYVNYVDYEEVYSREKKKTIKGVGKFQLEAKYDLLHESDVQNYEAIGKETVLSEHGFGYVHYSLGDNLYLNQERDILINPLRVENTNALFFKELGELMSDEVFGYEEMSGFLRFSEEILGFEKERLIPFSDESKKQIFTDIIYLSFNPEKFIEKQDLYKTEGVLPIRVNREAIEGELYTSELFLKTIKNTLIEASNELLEDADEKLFFKELIEKRIEHIEDKIKLAFSKIKTKIDEELIGLISAHTSLSKVNFKNYISHTGDGQKYKELLISRLSEKTEDIQIDLKGEVREVKLLPIQTKKGIVSSVIIEPFIESPRKDDPANFIKVPLTSNSFTLKYDGNVSSVIIHDVSPVDKKSDIEMPLNKKRNKTTKGFKIDKDFAKDFDEKLFNKPMGKRRTMIVDEADDKAGGESGDILSNIFNKSGKNIIVATGTPVNGYAENIVRILKLGGNMSLESIEQTALELDKLFGVKEIRSTLIALISKTIEINPDIKKLIQKIFVDYQNLKNDKNDTANIQTEMMGWVEEIKEKFLNEEIITEEQYHAIEAKDEILSMKVLFDGILVLKKKSNSDITILVQSAISKASSLSKDIPKISSMKGFAQSVFSIMGEDTISSTDAGLEKETTFIGSKENLLNFDKNNPLFTQRDFIENNRIGVRIVQATLQQYTKDKFIAESYGMLTQNYGAFFSMMVQKTKQGVQLREALVKEIAYMAKVNNIEGKLTTLQEKEVLTMMNKTTTEATDSFLDWYKQHLRTNGEYYFVKDGDEYSELRGAIFATTLPIFNAIMKRIPTLNEEIQKNIEKERFDDGSKKDSKNEKEIEFIIKSELDEEEVLYDFSGIKYNYSPFFQNTVGGKDVQSYLISGLEDGLPNNMAFSFWCDLCPSDLREHIAPDENGYRLPYRYELVNKDENVLLDVVGSIGIKKQFEQQLRKGANVLAVSSRVFSNSVNVLNYISALDNFSNDYKNNTLSIEEKAIYEETIEANVRMIINETSGGNQNRFDLKDVMKRIHTDYAEVLPTKRNILDATMNKSVRFDNKTTSLYSQYVSISRGFDLSYLHKKDAMATLNFTDPVGGGNTIQVLSRLENPKTVKNNVSLYNGGYDAKIYLFGEEGTAVTAGIFGNLMKDKTTSQEIQEEMGQVVSSLISSKNDALIPMLKNIIAKMNMPMPYGKTETSLNALKTEMGVETYKMVMKGEYNELDDKERKLYYHNKPIIDTTKVKIPASVLNSVKNSAIEENNITDEKIEEVGLSPLQ